MKFISNLFYLAFALVVGMIIGSAIGNTTLRAQAIWVQHLPETKTVQSKSGWTVWPCATRECVATVLNTLTPAQSTGAKIVAGTEPRFTIFFYND